MVLRRRNRSRHLALVVGAVVMAALVGTPPAAGGTSAADEPTVAPVEIVELELGEIPETTGPRMSAAFAGQDTEPATTTDAAPPLADLPIAPEVLQESVIGADGRTRETNTTIYPHRAIGQLDIVEDGMRYYCTGWLIDRNSVVTAGHCAYNPGGANDPIDLATFVPGRNNNGVSSYAPFGYCPVNALFAPYRWRVEGKRSDDWAIMQIDCDLGTTVGWFGMYTLPGTNRFAGTRARVQGYPLDKESGTQWQMTGSVYHSTDRRLFYPMDTAGGQSGSPVFKWNRPSCGSCVMAIHTASASGTPPNNSGTRITASVFDKILQIRAQNG